LFDRSFIYSEINTFGLPKFSKISFAFKYFRPYPCATNGLCYVMAIQKITPMDVSVSGTIDQTPYLKKFRGVSAPLDPPGSAYGLAPRQLRHWLQCHKVSTLFRDSVLLVKPRCCFIASKRKL